MQFLQGRPEVYVELISSRELTPPPLDHNLEAVIVGMEPVVTVGRQNSNH